MEDGFHGNKVSQQRRLLRFEEVCMFLQLKDDQVRFLINTRQLGSIRMVGEERFDSADLEGLVDSYKRTAQRHERLGWRESHVGTESMQDEVQAGLTIGAKENAGE